MALLFIDSFDHYPTAYLDKKWNSASSGCTVVAAAGRCSSQGLRVAASPGVDGVIKGVACTGDTAIFGCAYKSSSGSNQPIIAKVMAGSTPIICFYHQSDGSILGKYNPDAAFPPTSFLSTGGLVSHGVYEYVEFKVKLHASAGTVDIQVNGKLVYSATGLVTSSDGSTWTGVGFGGSSFSNTMFFDDIYIADASGSAPWNDFLGDIRVERLRPTAAGAEQDWDLGAGSDHWSAVDDDVAPDDDSSYIKTQDLNDTDTQIFQDSSLPSGASVYGVQFSFLAKKDQASNRLIAPVVRQAGVDYLGNDLAVNQDTYEFAIDMQQTNPATSAQWEIDEVNADEFGVKVTR